MGEPRRLGSLSYRPEKQGVRDRTNRIPHSLLDENCTSDENCGWMSARQISVPIKYGILKDDSGNIRNKYKSRGRLNEPIRERNCWRFKQKKILSPGVGYGQGLREEPAGKYCEIPVNIQER